MVFNYNQLISNSHLGSKPYNREVRGFIEEIERRFNLLSRHIQLFYVGKVIPEYEGKTLFPGGISFQLKSQSLDFPEPLKNKFSNMADSFGRSGSVVMGNYLPFLFDHYEVFLNYLRNSNSQEDARRDYLLAAGNGKLGRDLLDLSGELKESINSGLHDILCLRDSKIISQRSSIKQLEDFNNKTQVFLNNLKSQRNFLEIIVENLKFI